MGYKYDLTLQTRYPRFLWIISQGQKISLFIQVFMTLPESMLSIKKGIYELHICICVKHDSNVTGLSLDLDCTTQTMREA